MSPPNLRILPEHECFQCPPPPTTHLLFLRYHGFVFALGSEPLRHAHLQEGRTIGNTEGEEERGAAWSGLLLGGEGESGRVAHYVLSLGIFVFEPMF